MADESSSGGIQGRLASLRKQYPFFDHLMAMNEHYGKVEGSVLAGAVTYFGFLSFFPILALAFAVVGYISVAYPDARDSLITAVEQVFPGIVSSTGKAGTISLAQIESAKAAAGIIGFVGVLYSGLGWVSGLRAALEDTFEVPRSEKRNFIVGKGVDLVALVLIGFIMIVSVGLAGVVKGAADVILKAVGLSDSPIGTPLIWALGIVLGVCASTLLFFAMYRVLGSPDLPAKPLWQGAFFGAVGFEVLKVIVVNVIGGVGGSAFAPLAIAITLVVWINYFSRLILYGASWAVTSPHAYTVVTRRTDHFEAVAAAADVADDRSRTLVGAGGVLTEEEDGPGSGRFDVGSAVFGALAGFVAAVVVGRRGE